MIKKLSLMLILIFTLFASTNATTYLNSCGQSITQSNEKYILNFTSTDYNGFCLRIPYNILIENITITSKYPIQINSTGFSFLNLDQKSSSDEVTYGLINSKIYNITFNKKNNLSKINRFISISDDISGGSQSSRNYKKFYNNNIENININLPLFTLFFIQNPVSNYHAHYSQIEKNKLINISIINNQHLIYFKIFTNYDSEGNAYVRYNNIINSNIFSNDTIFFETTSSYSYYNNWEFNNSIFISKNDVINNDWNYDNSITSNYNGIESNPHYTNVPSNRLFNNENYVLSVYKQSGILDNIKNYIVNKEDVEGSNLLVIGNNQKIDLSLARFNFSSNLFNIQMTGDNNLLECNKTFNPFTKFDRCVIHNQENTNIFDNTKFKPIIALDRTNNTIKDITYIHNGNSNTNMIANMFDQMISNILIENTHLYNYYPRASDYINSTNMIKLKASDVTIKNNNFYVSGTDTTSFEDIYIESTNPKSNKIYNNHFYNLNPNSTINSSILTFRCDTKFYNNYIGNDSIVSDNCNNVIINPLVSYEKNNKVYYWYMGNYYESNTNCNDSNGNGFCDSPYTSGIIQDNRSLSEYPFDFEAHLFTANYIVDKGDYNITLYGISNGEVANLNSENDGILFKFSQDSNYPDLNCYYLLDGASVYTQENPQKDIIYNYTKIGGWENKNYTFRVECYNDAQGYVSSEEINFQVIIGSSGSNGDSSITNGQNINIIGETTQETSKNIKSLIKDVSNGTTNIVLTIGGVVFAFLVIGGLIGLIS